MGVFVIAEAGVNHNGDLNLAVELVKAAARAGADAVKFQAFVAQKLVSVAAPKADYQKKSTNPAESQLEMLKALEFGPQELSALKRHCDERGVAFMASVFNRSSVDLLVELGVESIKIPSGEITNLPLLQRVGRSCLPVILSTGMADLGEIEDALDVLYETGTKRDQITLLHCTTEYPAPFEQVNLGAMATLRNAFQVKVGYSDHTTGIEVGIAAAALGARVIEKHFTLDRTMSGPDHAASLEPDELRALVLAVRNVEKAFGDGIKKPCSVELSNRELVRKSIVAAAPIAKGNIIREQDLGLMRPSGGMSPMLWNQVVGSTANQDYEPGDRIRPS